MIDWGVPAARPRRQFAVPILLAAGSGVLFFWNLGRASLQDWDEATYAEISREIWIFHDWIHLHWNYLPWFNKAPLYIWMTAALYPLGVNAFWARAVSALAAVGTILITYGIGNRFYGRLVGIGSAVVLASCYQFIAAGRFGTSDMLLTFFLYGGLYAYVQTREHTRWWFGVGGQARLWTLRRDGEFQRLDLRRQRPDQGLRCQPEGRDDADLLLLHLRDVCLTIERRSMDR